MTEWGPKKSFTDARKHARQTGGGPPPKPPTAAELKIIDLMKDRPNFSGIVGGFETSMPSTQDKKKPDSCIGMQSYICILLI